MSTFDLMLKQCGLSRREAAEYFDVSDDTIHSWAQGRRTPNPRIFEQLATLYRHIYDVANNTVALMNEQRITPRDILKSHTGVGFFDAQNGADELPCDGARKAAETLALLLCLSADEEEDQS